MARKQFDASLKDAIEGHAADWAAPGATGVRGVRMIDADVSTVTAAADKAMLIDSGGPEWILHPELASGRDLELPHKIWWYNSVFHRRHRRLVRSVVLLLRPAADGPDLTGEYALRFPEESEAYNVFRYQVVRLWKLSAERLLDGGIGVLPLATLTDDAATVLPEVIARIDHRLRTETSADEARKLRATTTIVMGLRHSPDFIQHALQGVTNMWDQILEDSSIVQESVKRGTIAHARKQLLRLGQAKFGPPDHSTATAIDMIGDLDRLDALAAAC